jgi:hypothetical protein
LLVGITFALFLMIEMTSPFAGILTRSDARQEWVDLRVLPLIFRFASAKALNLYPGQLVDVYARAK